LDVLNQSSEPMPRSSRGNCRADRRQGRPRRVGDRTTQSYAHGESVEPFRVSVYPKAGAPSRPEEAVELHRSRHDQTGRPRE
jgi:hypothetical protein